MVNQPPSIDFLFDAALRIEACAERTRFLDQHCQGDPHLRAEVERLLEAHEDSQSFLNQPPPNFDVTVQHDPASNNPVSVLRALGKAFGVNASVVLRDAAGDSEEPVQNLSSTEVPQRDPNARYQLFGEIARGGMGAVIKGRDTDLGRDLAVKVLLDQHKEKSDVIQRFVEEAQIGGQLQHPGIAPVYELGQFADQRPYFTMKLIKGKTLSTLLESRETIESDRGKFIGIFEQVCQTMAYAHSRGVIHRDLKPANIMVGAFGEVQVMDWGLAKVLSSGGVADEEKAHEMHQDRSVIETLRSSGSDTPAEFGSQTQMGSVMGTPAYMPPEQALGEIDQLNQRADVFGLGAILCEILTGKPPYVAEDQVNVFRLATRAKLDECFKRLDETSGDQELIRLAKQCLAAEPADRPHDADVLADRVSKQQEAVEIRLRESEIDRAAQTARAEEEYKRRRIRLALAASILALVTAVTGSGFWLQTQKATAAERIAQKNSELAAEEREKARVEAEAKEELRWVLYQSEIQRAQSAVERGRFSAAKEILMAHVPKDGQRDLRGFEWHFLFRQCPVATRDRDFQWASDVLQMHDHWRSRRSRWWTQVTGDRFDPITVSRDQKRIAALDKQTNQIVVWSTETGERKWSTNLDKSIDTPVLKLNEDGSLVGLCTVGPNDAFGGDGEITVPVEVLLWDVENGRQISQVSSEQLPRLQNRRARIEFRPAARSIAIWTTNRQSASSGASLNSNLGVIWDFASNRVQFEFEKGHVEFSPDGALLALHSSSPGTTKVSIIDAQSGKRISDLRATQFRLGRGAFSPDGTHFAMAAANRSFFSSRESDYRDTLLVWDVSSGSLVASAPSKAGFGEIKFSPSGEFVVLVPTHNQDLEVFRVLDGSLVMHVQDPFGRFAHFSEDDRYLQTIDEDGALWRWQLPKVLFSSDEYAIAGESSLSGDGKRIERQGWRAGKNTVTIFDSSGRKLRSLKLPWDSAHIRGRRLNHNGSILAVEHVDDTSTMTKLSLWDLGRDEFVSDLFQSSENQSLKRWTISAADSKLSGIISITSDDSAASPMEQLRIWDLKSLQPQNVELTGQVGAIEFSADGREIAVFTSPQDDKEADETSQDRQHSTRGTLTFYDTATRRPSRQLRIPGVWDELVFSQDGCFIAGRQLRTGQDAHVEIWNLQTAQRQAIIDQAPTQMVVSPDGSRLITIKQVEKSNRPSDVFSIWDSATGTRLLSREYYGRASVGSNGFRFLPNEHRIVGLHSTGPPQIWDGTPVQLSNE